MTKQEHRERFFRTLAYTCWTVALIGATGYIFTHGSIKNPIIIASVPMAFLGAVFMGIRDVPQRRAPTDSTSGPR